MKLPLLLAALVLAGCDCRLSLHVTPGDAGATPAPSASRAYMAPKQDAGAPPSPCFDDQGQTVYGDRLRMDQSLSGFAPTHARAVDLSDDGFATAVRAENMCRRSCGARGVRYVAPEASGVWTCTCARAADGGAR